MSMIAMRFRKLCLAGLAVGMGMFSMPAASAMALVPNEAAAPPTPSLADHARLEWVWTREQAVYNLLGTFFDHIDQRLANGQALIDKAKARGRDVSAVQAAFDAFSNAVKQARPIYESMQGIVAAHPGFDSNGKVTDPVKAMQTVKDMRDKLRSIRQLLLDPRRALREAIQAFRQTNRPAQPAAPTPSS